MKKKLLSITLISFIFVIGLLSITHIFGSKITAAPLSGQSNIKTAPGINVIPGGGPEIEISGDYGLLFQLTDNVSYEPIGNIPTIDLTGAGSKAYKFTPNITHGGQGVWVRNAALYNGQAVDMKVVVDNLTFKKNSSGNYPSFYFLGIQPEDRTTEDKSNPTSVPNSDASKIWGDYYLYMGCGSEGLVSDSYTNGDKADYHYEFYDAKTGNPIQLKGAWNFNNINTFKKASIPFTESNYSSMYVLDIADIGYTNVNNVFEISSTSEELNKPSGRITHLFNASKYEVSMTKADGALQHAQPTGAMGVMYSNQSIARIAPDNPIIHGKKNDADYTSPEYKKMYYSILQNVSDNIELNRNTGFSIISEVPSFYDIESVEIYKYGTTDKLNTLFNISKAGSKLTLIAKNPTSDEFNGELLDIQVVAKPNTTFKFDKNIYQYKYDVDLDEGYMNFELGGPTPKTTTRYEYKTKTGDVKFSGNLDSEIVDGQSAAKVRYQAIPYADPKKDLKAEVNTDIKTNYPDPKSIIENLRLDTGESIDTVSVTYKVSGPIMTGSVEGDTTNVVVVLTTKDGIQEEVTVPITAKDVYGKYTVKFLDEGNVELVKAIELDEKPIGYPTDLTTNQAIQNTVKGLVDKGYVRQPWKDDNGDTLENAFPITDLAGTIIYRFKGNINFQVTDTMPFKQGMVNPAVNQILPYAGTDDFSISVKDLRSVNGATGEKKGDFSIQASLTDGFKKNDKSGSSLTHTRLLYNKSGNDADDVEISATGSPIYQGTEGDNSDVVIKLDSGNKVGAMDKKGLRLELDKGNNAEKNVTYEATVTWYLIYGP